MSCVSVVYVYVSSLSREYNQIFYDAFFYENIVFQELPNGWKTNNLLGLYNYNMDTPKWLRSSAQFLGYF